MCSGAESQPWDESRGNGHHFQVWTIQTSKRDATFGFCWVHVMKLSSEHWQPHGEDVGTNHERSGSLNHCPDGSDLPLRASCFGRDANKTQISTVWIRWEFGVYQSTRFGAVIWASGIWMQNFTPNPLNPWNQPNRTSSPHRSYTKKIQCN